ncbi:MAG TPA: ABC transporter ATP-binding protein, partial [Gemmatimonadales bacterium]|nr:ABC transporter ATP-binding protein [Gemmatimonadales bacterium]
RKAGAEEDDGAVRPNWRGRRDTVCPRRRLAIPTRPATLVRFVPASQQEHSGSDYDSRHAKAFPISHHRPPDSMIRAESLSKEYLSGGRPLRVLKDITFTIAPGEIVSIVGPSGSGKTTLLGLLAGLDRPSSGRVVLDGQDLTALSEDGLARFRGSRVGFVFQSFHLLPTLTARENVQVPLELQGESAEARADELLARVGLTGREHHYPAQLSGGEQQRVALARAFSNRPRILFADEPTGNLDAATGAKVVDIMFGLNREFGTTTVMVTHDLELAAKAQRVIRLADGALVSDTPSAIGLS